jgi:hypothetical protein
MRKTMYPLKILLQTAIVSANRESAEAGTRRICASGEAAATEKGTAAIGERVVAVEFSDE